MFTLSGRRKESGLSLIESALVIVLSGIVIVLVQSAISKIINKAVHVNSLHDISYIMNYIQDTLQYSCYDKSGSLCDEQISSIMSDLNTSDKIEVDIERSSDSYISVYLVYSLSNNEDFGNLLLTNASAYYGILNDSIVSSVLGWWKVNTVGTIFSGKDGDNYLFFYNYFMVKTV